MATLTSRTSGIVRGNQPRCPCILLLDISQSMQGTRIAQLNEGLRRFKEALLEDDVASLRVEVALITFSTTVELATDFQPALDFEPPVLEAHGKTALYQAILEGIALSLQRKKAYKDKGIPYYQPWMFMLTDGSPTDDPYGDEAKRTLREYETKNKVVFYAVGVDDPNTDMDLLRSLSIHPAIQLKQLAFKDLFRWISQSVSTASRLKGDIDIMQNPAVPFTQLPDNLVPQSSTAGHGR